MKGKYIINRTIIAHKARGVPVGCLTTYNGDKAPEGWLFCQDQKVGKQQYPELYAVIGDTFQKQEKNPRHKWYTFWEPKTLPELLVYDFRLPDFNGYSYSVRGQLLKTEGDKP